jgi:hypothetical protein
MHARGDATRARAPKGQTVIARGGTPGTTPHNALRALKGHTEQGARGRRSPRWGEVSWGGVTQGSAPLHPGLSPCVALRRGRPRDACPGRCDARSCPEGATGDSPGWNPGDHATQRPPCPERAHGTGCAWSPFAPLGRGGMGWGAPGFRSAPPRAVAVRRVAARAGARCMSGPDTSPKERPLTSDAGALWRQLLPSA